MGLEGQRCDRFGRLERIDICAQESVIFEGGDERAGRGGRRGRCGTGGRVERGEQLMGECRPTVGDAFTERGAQHHFLRIPTIRTGEPVEQTCHRCTTFPTT